MVGGWLWIVMYDVRLMYTCTTALFSYDIIFFWKLWLVTITHPTLATFTRSKFVLRLVIYIFLMNIRTIILAKGSEEIKWLVVPLLLNHWSKSRNWITQPIMATFTRSSFVLRLVICTFLMNIRTPRLAQRKWRNGVISCTSPSVSLIKKSKFNYSTNTGHITSLNLFSTRLYCACVPRDF